MKRIILHVDVNNAFLSWTALLLLKEGYKEDIRKLDAIIGGDEDKRRGVVLAKSTSAKKKGVVTGETLYNARKKCPNLQTFSPNYHFYQEMSNKLFTYLSSFTPDIEQFSIDECFLDYTHIKHLYGDELKFAYKIKDEIKEKLGFTVNVGIGNNKLCAKMASDFEKPDRVHTLYEEEIKTKMWLLAIEDLYGVGRKTAPKLRKIGINTIGDLANFDLSKISSIFKKQGLEMWRFSNGKDDSPVIPNETDNKCISNSTTLAKNILNRNEAYPVIMALAENVGLSLRQQKKYAYVIAIQIRDKYFHNYSHQKKLDNPTNLTSDIYNVAIKLFNDTWDEEPIRLIGLRLDKLTAVNPYQISLFEEVEEKEMDTSLQETIDILKNKYGSKIIRNAVTKESAIKKKYQK